MNRINILDCTLRDGGYINDFDFSKPVIDSIIGKLSAAAIDVIECGFLQSGTNNENKTLYGSVEEITTHIGKKNPNSMYVAMIQLGKMSEEEISDYDGFSIDGIRLTFHEHEIEEAFHFGKILMEKGYKLFMQPVGTTTYKDEALLELIKKINEIKPFAFYIVDTLGTMYRNDLLRMFYLVDNNLNRQIALGFHSHNNLQMSFSNAQDLMQLGTSRRLIIDTSVYGMGRGAGNLNTELVTQYINSNVEFRYDNLPILEIIDEYIRPLSMQYKWGYDAAYYLASVLNCHPNYATYLINLQTLHVQDIYAILSGLDSERSKLFDKAYIGEEYIRYMNHHIDDSNTRNTIKNEIGEKKVLILAPGKSLRKMQARILDMINTDEYYVISVNFFPEEIPVDLVFASNMKRFGNSVTKASKEIAAKHIVVTSNIITERQCNLLVADYASYLNEEQCIVDNAGLMCVNFLKKIGCRAVLLAGFDGFSTNIRDNYYLDSLCVDVEAEHLLKMNIAISKKMQQLSKQMEIQFISDSVYNGEYNEKV